MYCTCGCGNKLGVYTFSDMKKPGEFYSAECMKWFYEDKQLEFPDNNEDDNKK